MNAAWWLLDFATDLQAANTNGQLRDSLVTEANARAVALRADVAAREEQAATAAAAAQDRLSISVDVNINVPFTYTEGQDAVEVARAFCTQHGLDEASNVPALIQLLRSKAAEEAQGREAAAQAAAAAAAAQREPLLKVPLTIGGNQVTINLYDGDVIADVAANVCSELNNNEVYPELVKVLTDRVRAM